MKLKNLKVDSPPLCATLCMMLPPPCSWCSLVSKPHSDSKCTSCHCDQKTRSLSCPTIELSSRRHLCFPRGQLYISAELEGVAFGAGASFFVRHALSPYWCKISPHCGQRLVSQHFEQWRSMGCAWTFKPFPAPCKIFTEFLGLSRCSECWSVQSVLSNKSFLCWQGEITSCSLS